MATPAHRAQPTSPAPPDPPVSAAPVPSAGRRRAAAGAAALAGALALTGPAAVADTGPSASSGSADAHEALLLEYAATTWASFDAMAFPETGLPTDKLDTSLEPDSRRAYTSPTNIGAYLWSTVVARELDLIDGDEAHQRLERTVTTLESLERHEDSGQFYNWYDPATGDLVEVWPEDGEKVDHFASSVDNGWLAAALAVVSNAEPALHERADDLLQSMDFGYYYDPHVREDGGAGQLRGGFWAEEPADDCSVPGKRADGKPAEDKVWFTCNHYDLINSETRIATYVGIGLGQIPREHYFGAYRTFPDTCEFADVQSQMPEGEWTEHWGVPVFQGSFEYRDTRYVPSWGGGMFEAMMPPLFVPEEDWAPDSWGRTNPAFVHGQIEHGLDEAEYGYWGFSPSSDPFADYGVYGAPALGMGLDAYPSDREGTEVDYGFGDCREPGPEPEFGDGVVTPHAAFMALSHAPEEAVDNLERLRADFDVYGQGGFADAVAVGSGTVAELHLSLDQGMAMAALGNELADDVLRDAFTEGEIGERLRPVMGVETFNIPADQEVGR
ncbi:glucoamylase family protein [Nocardiopsis nanhaiensis]